MEKLRQLPEGILSGTAKVDEGYVPATSKGMPLETNGEECTYASRRKMKRGPGRGKFEKDTPMLILYHERKDSCKTDLTHLRCHVMIKVLQIVWRKSSKRDSLHIQTNSGHTQLWKRENLTTTP